MEKRRKHKLDMFSEAQCVWHYYDTVYSPQKTTTFTGTQKYILDSYAAIFHIIKEWKTLSS